MPRIPFRKPRHAAAIVIAAVALAWGVAQSAAHVPSVAFPYLVDSLVLVLVAAIAGTQAGALALAGHVVVHLLHAEPAFDTAPIIELAVFVAFNAAVLMLLHALRSRLAQARTNERAALAHRSSLELAERGYRIAFDHVHDPLWDWDIDTGACRWNSQARRLFGYDREATEHAFDWWMARIHADDRERVARALRRMVEHGPDRWQDGFRFECADHSYADITARCHVVRDARGRAGHVLCVMTDLREDRRSDDGLRESERRFGSLFTQTAAGIVQIDLSGHLIRVNRRFCALVGRDESVLLKLRWQDLLDPDDMQAVQQRVDALLRGGVESFAIEQRYSRPDGSQRLTDVGVSVICDSTGQPSSLVAIVLDASERLGAERALRESEARYRVLTEVSPQVVWMADAQGRLVYVNRPWVDYSGHAMDRTLITGWREAVHPDHHERLAEAWGATKAAEGDWRIELPLRRADAQYRWHEIRGLPLRDEQGRIVNWMGTIVDVHETHEADRRKDEFIATLAHELRNPLAPVRNAIELLKLSPNDPRTIEHARGLMERQIATMVRLIDDLLDVSRIKRGTLELKRRVVPIREVVASAMETCGPTLEQLGHRVATPHVDPAWLVDGDATRLSQAICNLLHNAAKYTPVGGRISLQVERVGLEVHLTVHDSGIGLARHMLERVFDMFSQVESPGARSSGGLGIGLTLTRRLIDMHAGRVEAYSRGLGHGCTFVIALPLAAKPAMPMPMNTPDQTQHAPPQLPSTPKKILVADDNVDAAESLSAILGFMGHETRVAYDGREALAIAEAFHPDVAVLDIGMPHLDGCETARALKERPWAQRLVLIALTGWGQRDDQERSANAGFAHHIVKPVDPDQLAALIATGSDQTTQASRS